MSQISQLLEKCSGCHACEYTCPSHAIRFYENKEGFGYPTVNMMSCTSCGTCAAVCPMEHPLYMYGEKYTYAAYDTREEALKKAASGGLFGLLGEAVLRLGGVVCGCANDENLLPHHIFAEDLEHLDLLKKTKLAESDLTGIYPAVADYLERGRPVLFSWTPCQVAGLRAYLNKIHGTRDEENLYLVDVICYGVPSRSLFAHHLRYLEKKNGGRIISYTFQPKTRYE